jgi:hypothetical protein
MIRSGANQYGPGEQLFESAYQLVNNRIGIECPLTSIHEFGFDGALKKVRNPTSGRFFIKVDYKFGGEDWVIYAPSRYVNFPDANTAGIYLQPIFGYILFYKGQRFIITYVVVNIKNSGCRIEFIARELLSFMEAKAKESRLRKCLQIFSPVLNKILRTDEFWKVYVVEGKTVIHEYK